ncbi:Histone-fold [Penicillium chermesinum]|uniref:Histone-fold n=1 Tax=Penicillium chermesinum TaxID=63820 RepID=A0A9W9PJH4_9EURO|nr:Histone-fold [Penicillium chermesinum]KAJ5247091.1 Histone-fold [Penicillium chermesinum]
MASPSQTQGSGPATQPLTPPAESSSAPNGVPASTAPAPATAPTTSTAPPPHIPGTSIQDSGKSRRPRDVRLVHMLLASLGVTSYQDRVPLQLLDFAYRYTSNVLQDSVHLATEGYANAVDNTGATGKNAAGEVNNVSLGALRLSIASRLHYQFQAGLPKEFLMDVASERNRIALPGVSRGFDQGNNQAQGAANQSVMMAGMRLPPERFCLTGTGWNMKDEWESEGEEDLPDATEPEGGEAGE